MKTFESEIVKLRNWILKKNDEYIENMKKEMGKSIRGHDSEVTYRYSQDVREYNRRLTALKKKYGITVPTDTSYEHNPTHETPRYASGK